MTLLHNLGFPDKPLLPPPLDDAAQKLIEDEIRAVILDDLQEHFERTWREAFRPPTKQELSLDEWGLNA